MSREIYERRTLHFIKHHQMSEIETTAVKVPYVEGE